jgi:hypothetical protein
LDGNCIIIKELGTVFGLRADKVKKFLGDLQAIYDREYHKATGTVGTIHGKAAFTIVACVTPATLRDHHEYMARIGPRFLTYRPARSRKPRRMRASGFSGMKNRPQNGRGWSPTCGSSPPSISKSA